MKANVQVHILLLLRSHLESVQSTLRVKAGSARQMALGIATHHAPSPPPPGTVVFDT